jgi:hypothetical protein
LTPALPWLTIPAQIRMENDLGLAPQAVSARFSFRAPAGQA